MITQEAILAGLKKIGPCRPGELADHLEVEHTSLGYHLKKLLDAGSIKAIGTAKARRIALPDQQFTEAEAPPQQRKTPKSTKRRKTKRASKPRQAPTPRAARTAERFIPTVDAEKRLVIVNGGEPTIFDGPQTEAIATLILQHYAPE